MSVVLWHIEVSHYNEKVRWALDYKGVPYEKRVPVPGLHGLTALRLTRGAQRRLPVIKLDGKPIGDSTAIIAALEQRFPDPPLYPAKAAERAAALNLEEFFDEHLAPDVRRFVFHHTLPDIDASVDSLMPGASRGRKRLMRVAAPAMRPFIRADYQVSAEEVERSVGRIRAAMDRLEAELEGSDYLVGSRFGVADLTAAALFTPLLAPPGRPYTPVSVVPAVAELRVELEARPGGQWVHETYRRHRLGSPGAATGADLRSLADAEQ